ARGARRSVAGATAARNRDAGSFAALSRLRLAIAGLDAALQLAERIIVDRRRRRLARSLDRARLVGAIGRMRLLGSPRLVGLVALGGRRLGVLGRHAIGLVDRMVCRVLGR